MEPTHEDWNKLIKMMKFLAKIKDDMLMLKANNLQIAKCNTNVSFAVYSNFCSHTGISLLFGKETITRVSRKQMMNTRSLIEAELVGADKAVGLILWTALFMES